MSAKWEEEVEMWSGADLEGPARECTPNSEGMKEPLGKF